MKTIACKDMGMKNCPWKGEGETTDELVEEVKNHLETDHKDYWDENKMSEDELKEKVESNEKEE